MFTLKFSNLKFFALAVVSTVIIGCAASSPYPDNYPLTEEVVKSLNGELELKVPQGWFSTVDQNSPPNLLAWLVKEDYSATMAITEIQADEVTRRKITKEGLETLAFISFKLKAERAKGKGELISEPKGFKLNDQEFCSYEYSPDGRQTIVRVVVFATEKHLYDFAMVPIARPGMKIDQRSLFVIQQSVLSSLRW